MNTPERAWGRSGLAALTGMFDGSPDFSRAAVLVEAQRVADDVGTQLGVLVDAAEVLAGRAAQLGLRRRGRVSAGGATRLLAAVDGWCAVTLSRPDDIEAIPALIEAPYVGQDHWAAVERWVATQSAAAVVARAVLFGIPAAVLGETQPSPPRVVRSGPSAAAPPASDLLVADLSSMWAGPLCGRLLAQAGATVVKVETYRRPDGTRAGSSAFFDWINHGKLSFAIDFDSEIEDLRELLRVADVVIEGSRAAALTGRGCGPDDVAATPGRVWVRVTGHGTDGENADRVAFGDDAAVAGGLVAYTDDGPVFCADAIADPLTGLHAALAVAQSLSRGGGELVELSMAATAAIYASLPLTTGVDIPHDQPAHPPQSAPGPALGADNLAVRRIVAERHTAPC